MNCQEFESRVAELARGQASRAKEAAGVEAHAAACKACAAMLAEQQILTKALHALASQTAGEQAPARVEAALRLNLKGQSVLANRRASEPRPATRSRLAWGIAAVIVAAAGIIVAARFRRTPPASNRPSLAQSSLSPARPHPEESAVTSGGQLNQASTSGTNAGLHSHVRSTRRLAARQPTRRAPATPESANPEVVTAFYPLPYGSGLSLDDGWELVRVRMPVTALTAIGVPLADESSSAQFVKADVVLGEDGMARAIRFVQ